MAKLVDHATYSGAGLDPSGLAAWRALLRAHAAVTKRLEQDLARGPVSLSEFDVLATLAQHPEGALRMRDLAERVLLTKSGITRLADRLEERGLIARRECALDRRGQYAALTPAGRAALREAARVHLPGIARAFADHLAPREHESVAKALERVALANGAPPVRPIV